jgi:hypothetical protein
MRLRKKRIDVGWLFNESADATFVWFEPERFSRNLPMPEVHRSLLRCPAVSDFESRYFVIRCPYDITLRLIESDNEAFGGYEIMNADGLKSPVSENILHLDTQAAWRNPNRPVLQVWCPYRFISDDPVWLSLLPPFLEPMDWPGIVISARFPIHIWPRVLNWGFEWYKTSEDLVLRRGQPWMYIYFETEKPDSIIRLVKAERTSELTEYFKGLDNTVKYIRHTFSLFDVAKSRRPKKLLKPKGNHK